MADQVELWQRAGRVKRLTGRVRMPVLADWNYEACEHHTEPVADCAWRLCGSEPFNHQTRTSVFHYMAKRTIDASQTGTGKTNGMLLTLCLVKHYGDPVKALIVVPTGAVQQWSNETARFAPGLRKQVVTSQMTKAERLAAYATDWEVLIIGFHLMVRDIQALEALHPVQVFSDDVDPILQLTNATHKAMIRLTRQADRVTVANATNLQTRLDQLYAASLVLYSAQTAKGFTSPLWGSLKSFKDRYVRKEFVYVTVKNSSGRKETLKTLKAVGYQNMRDFKSRFGQQMIRIRYEDLGADARVPDIVSQNVYVDLHPEQQRKYALLQDGVLELQKVDMPPSQKMVSALTAWTHGQQICAGLPALGEADGPGASSKLDWVIDHVTGEWSHNKVVVYVKNQGSIRALQARLDFHQVGYSTIWGPEAKADHRAAEIKRFWEDPADRVMIISAAGERSLNLQNASVLVSIDVNLNPARVAQIMGRVRRLGSSHSQVFVVNLLAADTQESRYLLTLATRQALFDHVHDEDNADLFERLDPADLLRLIRP